MAAYITLPICLMMIQLPAGGVASIPYNLNGPFGPHLKSEIVVFFSIAINGDGYNDDGFLKSRSLIFLVNHPGNRGSGLAGAQPDDEADPRRPRDQSQNRSNPIRVFNFFPRQDTIRVLKNKYEAVSQGAWRRRREHSHPPAQAPAGA
jgi:hypothetical protein